MIRIDVASGTDSYSTIQQVFQDHLAHLVNTAQDEFRITLHTTIPESPKQIIQCSRSSTGGTVKQLEIRVLTPAFYSRFVHYAYTSEAFDRECIFTDEKNRTCWVSHPELLAQLLAQSTTPKLQLTARRSPVSELRWSLLKQLRCAPAEPAYNPTPKSSEFRLEDIRAVRYSEMDNFVRSQSGQQYAGAYRRIATKLFLAQRFFLGFPQIIGLGDLILRLFLSFYAAQQLSSLTYTSHISSLDSNWRLILHGTMAVVASHAYALLKGY